MLQVIVLPNDTNALSSSTLSLSTPPSHTFRRYSDTHCFPFGFECSYRHSPSFTPPALKQSKQNPHKRSLCIFFTTSTARPKRVLTSSQKSHLSLSS